MQASPEVSLSPSFSSYSNCKLAGIAAPEPANSEAVLARISPEKMVASPDVSLSPNFSSYSNCKIAGIATPESANSEAVLARISPEKMEASPEVSLSPSFSSYSDGELAGIAAPESANSEAVMARISPEKMEASPEVSLSPSFSSYSNCNLAGIAARVVRDFESEEFYDEFHFDREENPANSEYVERESETENGDNRAEEEEFEFAFVDRETEFPSPIPADEIFHNGQIRPVYPVFNRDLFLECLEFQTEKKSDKKEVLNSATEKPTIRLPLRKLFIQERETTMTMSPISSSSSSEADELDGVPDDLYCVWRPSAAEERCKKSSSAGSDSKRWKFKHLLNRSQSDGSKGNLVILSASGRKKLNEEIGKPVNGGLKVHPPTAPPPPPMYYREGGEKRRSYLPYKRDLVGLLSNVNGLTKKLQPF